MASDGPVAPRLICLGKIVGVWGVQGWVKIHAYTRRRADILEYRHWLVGDGGNARRHTVDEGREQGRGLVAKLRELDDRDAAAALVGAPIHVSADQLPALNKGEYYWHQLEGLNVETLTGQPLGRVDYLFETGANDVMVVTGDRERLIPYVPEVVREVDLDAGLIRVDWEPDF